MSLFGQPANSSNTSGSLFGTAAPAKPSLFSAPASSTPTNDTSAGPQQQAAGLFGTSQPASSNTSGLFGNNRPAGTQPQQGSSLFGNTQSAPGGSLFGSNQQLGSSTQAPPPSGPTLFGDTIQSGSNVLGNRTQPQGQTGNLFGNHAQATGQTGTSLFGNNGSGVSNMFGNSGQTGNAPMAGSTQRASVLGQSQTQSRILSNTDLAPRQKSVIDQIELAFAKWNPQSPQTLFQTYVYNAVAPEDAPFYGPGPQDDETKWEEALARKPRPGSIPVAVRGFEELARRMQQQFVNLGILRGRLHEINDGLSSIMQKHEVETSVRASECRRKHLLLSKQCLNLATKTQLIRNRGYAMDTAEEELRRKLLTLERQVEDPALNGRGEEIWARMITVRERGRQLQREYDRAGKTINAGKAVVIDEALIRQAQKILDDYHSQLSHLAMEMGRIRKDWEEWEAKAGARR